MPCAAGAEVWYSEKDLEIRERLEATRGTLDEIRSRSSSRA